MPNIKNKYEALYFYRPTSLYEAPLAEVRKVANSLKWYLATVSNESLTKFLILPSGQVVEFSTDGFNFMQLRDKSYNSKSQSKEFKRQLWLLNTDRTRLLKRGILYVIYNPNLKWLYVEVYKDAAPSLSFAYKTLERLAKKLRVDSFHLEFVRHVVNGRPISVKSMELSLRELNSFVKRAGGVL